METWWLIDYMDSGGTIRSSSLPPPPPTTDVSVPTLTTSEPIRGPPKKSIVSADLPGEEGQRDCKSPTSTSIRGTERTMSACKVEGSSRISHSSTNTRTEGGGGVESQSGSLTQLVQVTSIRGTRKSVPNSGTTNVEGQQSRKFSAISTKSTSAKGTEREMKTSGTLTSSKTEKTFNSQVSHSFSNLKAENGGAESQAASSLTQLHVPQTKRTSVQKATSPLVETTFSTNKQRLSVGQMETVKHGQVVAVSSSSSRNRRPSPSGVPVVED